MLTADDAGPLEQSWRCQGFRILPNENWDWPEVYEPDGELAVLMMPVAWAASPEGREAACGFAISDLFETRYGRIMMQRGIAAWPGLVELMAARDREAAAD